MLLVFLTFGCTDSGPISIPYTTGQLINKSTDLNYTLFSLGNYSGQVLIIDGNRLSVASPGDLSVASPGDLNVTVDLNFLFQPTALGNYAGSLQIIIQVGDTNYSRTVPISAESLSVFTETSLLPKSYNLTSGSDTNIQKTFSVCNYTDSSISYSWSADGNMDANLVPWMRLPNLSTVPRKTCSSFDLNILVPVGAEGKTYDANIIATYHDGNVLLSHITITVVSEFSGYFSTFQSTDLNSLPANYSNSQFIMQRNDTNSWTFSGELDWNKDGNYNVNGSSWDQNLVAYYKFNSKYQSGGVWKVIDSVKGNDGNLLNGADINEIGMWDSNALRLNGVNQYVTIPNSISVKGLSERSISLWVNPSLLSGNYKPLFFESTPSNGYTRMAIALNSSGDINFGGRFLDADSYTVFATTNSSPLTAGKWSQIVVVFNGLTGVNKIFVNGIDKTSAATSKIGSFSNTIPYNSISFGYDTTYFVTGAIDEVKIYSRALSSSEILLDYNNFLSTKFVDSNIIHATSVANWDSIRINKKTGYSFGKEIEDWNTLKLMGINELGKSSDSNYLFSDQNLIGLWRLNDKNANNWILNSATGIYDGNLISGTDTNATGLWDTNAGWFNGVGGYIDVDLNSADKNLYSFSTWFKPSATLTSASTGLTLYSIPTSEGSSPSIILGSATSACNNEIITILSKNVGPNVYRTCYYSPASISPDWHNIISVWNGAYFDIYLDGKLLSGATIGTANGHAQLSELTRINFGDYNYINGRINWFSGHMDDVVLWSRSLTQNEVSDIYNSQRPMFQNGLVGLWHLNDKNSSGWVLNSATGLRDGNLVGGADTNATGLWDTNALWRDGNTSKYVQIPLNYTSQPTTLTISAWVKPGVTISSGSTERYVEYYNGINGGNRYGYLFGFSSNACSNNGKLNFVVGTNSGASWNCYSSNKSTWDANTWYHVAVTHTGVNYQFYINGIPEASGAATPIIYLNPMSGFYLGNGAMYGTIEEVAIWNRALLASEVKDLYQKGVSRLDLNVYSCSDINCQTKTSSQYISDANNGSWMDLNSSLFNSRYLGIDAYFKPSRSFSDYTAGTFYVGSFLNDINVYYSR